MSDYIDRQAALDAIQAEREYMTRREEWLAEHILTHCGYRIIEDMPAADVEPVVRCKDCRHRNGDYCHLYGGIAYEQFVRMTDFCSRGVREDGEADVDLFRPNKTTVLRRQYIIVKADYFISKEDEQNIKREILEQLKEDGVAVVDGHFRVITVDADVLAVE